MNLWFSRKILLFLAFPAITNATQGCSRETGSSVIRAVEVGNPEDSKPSNPLKPVPMRLLQIDLQAAQLEEISQINLTPESITITNGSPDGKQFTVSGGSWTAGSSFLLSPQSNQKLEFSLPQTLLQDRTGLKLEFKFNSASAGTVLVGETKYEIESSTQHLQLSLTLSESPGEGAEPFFISQTLTKNQLFESQTAANKSDTQSTNSVQAPPLQSTPPRAPSVQSPPAPAKQSVYKLRNSSQ